MIALSSYNFDPRIIRLSAALVEKNIDVDLFCLRYGDQKKLEIIDGVQVHRIMKNFNQESIFSYVIFSFFFLVKAMFKSILILYKNKTNLVHVHNMPDHLVFSAAFYKIRGIPIILDIHDLTLELFKEKWSEKRYNQFKSVLKFVEKLSVRFASRVITVSEQCAEKLIERGLSDKKLTVVMNAPDSKKFKYDTERTFHVINDN
ncbi:MAG: glycosyltransferase family 4 protein, partial [Ignavibacteriaceae bacterium]|nr:glycosyltransferase family 4 protein [Ignavibacteriaceae bacterium]